MVSIKQKCIAKKIVDTICFLKTSVIILYVFFKYFFCFFNKFFFLNLFFSIFTSVYYFFHFFFKKDDALSKTELVALMVEMKMRSITQTDLTESIKSIAEDADIVMKALDVDQNDTIQLDEFVDWLTEGLSRPSNERKK